MKKLLVIAIVMLVASMANAGLLISVNGVVNPADSEVILEPSQTAVIDIHGDGMTNPSIFFLGLEVMGPGSLDISNAQVLYAGNDAGMDMFDDGELAGAMNIQNPFVFISLNDIPTPPNPKAPLQGLLVDGILFHCDAPGDVVIALYDGDLNLLDTQVIHQIPEPMTMSLLGLGALLIRRK